MIPVYVALSMAMANPLNIVFNGYVATLARPYTSLHLILCFHVSTTLLQSFMQHWMDASMIALPKHRRYGDGKKKFTHLVCNVILSMTKYNRYISTKGGQPVGRGNKLSIFVLAVCVAIVALAAAFAGYNIGVNNASDKTAPAVLMIEDAIPTKPVDANDTNY
jgi:hypothetical protein